MPLYHLFLVAVIQGITEFLPISSSGHLILLPNLSGLDDQGQVIDVAVHVGSLFAVCVYFRNDVLLSLRGIGHLVSGNRQSPAAKLAFNLIIATIPVVIAGLILKITGLDDALRSVAVIGWAMLGFGIVLYWFDQKSPVTEEFDGWSVKQAIILGLWQAIALIPGTSRSGITITGARALGFDRENAARISMLMSIPTILASGGLLTVEVIATADKAAALDGAIAAGLAFLAALASLVLMMRLLKSVSFTPYVLYRIGFGVILLWYAYS
jgi:undecaprenyl-diphosphatase